MRSAELILQEGNASSWNLTGSEGQKYRVSVKKWSFKTDTTQAALIAAKEGLGAALLPIPLGESEKSLTRLLPNWTGVPVEVCAITSSRKISSAARNFIDLAKQEFNREQ
ncbi:MAG: LysR substrate-binding domain-containing protein [Parasutterella sp.]